MKRYILLVLIVVIQNLNISAQHSVARQWNDVMLEAIRDDFARPTVHARNLFHVSVAMYDAWAAYDETAVTYILGQSRAGVYTEFEPVTPSTELSAAQEEAISYAAYRLLSYRFRSSPGRLASQRRFDSLMNVLGYDIYYQGSNYQEGKPAALGNYIAYAIIEIGLQDGSNEADKYQNLHYEPINPPLLPDFPGNPDIADPNRWQPLTLEFFVDQSGHVISNNSPPFLSPEWGNVAPFCLSSLDLTTYERGGATYNVYMDPGPPPRLDTEKGGEMSDLYKWNFALVANWSSHLDPSDGVMWDISPASMGNIQNLPTSFSDYENFYKTTEGGDPGTGYTLNPVTGEPYQSQIVPRGDYTRVLAEFWADGPDSETPPGHWFTILNYVSDHPLLEKKFKGEGSPVGDLEWDIKAYFLLGCAMHDVAISAWSIKGWYDYIRPISAIRYLADQGQSTDPNLPHYSKNGIPLQEGYVDLVMAGDPLAGAGNQHLHKIKVKAWRGPSYIDDPETDVAGAGWILAENWWPYQRPSFVTPPFAGYISGHSTYSRAAAEILTLLTGSAYFPGGMGEFVANKDEFLVFEDGPSVDVKLQWATYRDASDQCSLSRIWGGIHPPADDINGRHIGKKIGMDAFRVAQMYFDGSIITGTEAALSNQLLVYPNPLPRDHDLTIVVSNESQPCHISLYDLTGSLLLETEVLPRSGRISLNLNELKQGLYVLNVNSAESRSSTKLKVK